MDDLHRPNLTCQRPQRRQTLIIVKLPNKDLQRRHVEEADAQLVPMPHKREHELGLVSLLFGAVGALGHHLAHFAVDDFGVLIVLALC